LYDAHACGTGGCRSSDQGPIIVVHTLRLVPRRTLVLVAALVLLALSASTPAVRADGVITRSVDAAGKGVFLDGTTPWKAIGWNDYTLSNHPVLGDQNCGNPMSSEDFGRQMDRIAATGATTVRVWFFQKYYQQVPGGQDPWRPFDRILAGAKARGLRVVPVLLNQWSACDRIGSQYQDGSGNLTTSFYDTGYKQAGGGPMAGYAYSARDWAAKVARHYNPDSGYASTIAFFQLVNEAETRTSPTSNACTSGGPGVLRRFADDMTGAVKAAYVDGVAGRTAPLVSLGTMGIGQCGARPEDAFPNDPADNRSEYKLVHDGSVDICEVHDYDAMNEAWPTNVYGIAGNSFQNRLDDCAGKPFVIGEAGIKANVGPNTKTKNDPGYSENDPVTATTLDQRAAFFDAKMGAAMSAGTDGYLLWDKYFLRSTNPDNKATHENFGIGAPGDPTTCVFRNYTAASNCSTSAQPVPPTGAPDSGAFTHYGFEQDSGGWGGDSWNGLQVGLSSYVHYGPTGTQALAVRMSADPTKAYSGVGTFYGLTNLDAGTVVTFYVHSAGDTNAVKVQPYVKNGSWAATFGPTVNLTGNGWQTVTYAVPASVDVVKAIGIHFINEQHQTGYVHVDEIRW
jgi:hypothetical protein